MPPFLLYYIVYIYMYIYIYFVNNSLFRGFNGIQIRSDQGPVSRTSRKLFEPEALRPVLGRFSSIFVSDTFSGIFIFIIRFSVFGENQSGFSDLRPVSRKSRKVFGPENPT